MIELTWGELNKSRFDAKLNAIFATGFSAGRVHQAKVDRDEVEKMDKRLFTWPQDGAIKQILAALAAVAPEVK
ncbi:MAG: hypothetical protein WC341_17220 [Bacteroidales bacterium]